MTPDELFDRIQLGEDSTTEFKDERVRPEGLAAAIVSFANASGGDVVIGVADDGRIVGVGHPDKLANRVDSVCRNNVEPPLGAAHVTLEKVRAGDQVVVVLHVSRGRQRPYRASDGVYYVRALAGRRAASRQELLEMLQSAQSLFPDEVPVEDAGIADLDLAYLVEQRPELKGLAHDALLRSLAAIKVMADATHPSLGGLLCFGADPQRARPYARITAIRQRGVAITEEFLDRQELAGVVARQISGAQAFVRRHVPPLPSSGAQPLYAFPYQAVDECLVNAVAHRDYLAAAQVRLFVYDDRVEVISPGQLLNSVTIEAMRQGYHLVRNPVVFNHLARLRLATDAGRGVPSMIELMRASGLPEPEISVVGHELRVVLRRTGAPA
jgi:ATP-dependent DNA helicase RecG